MSTPYDRLGGEAGIRALVDRFYELMDTLPASRRIRAMHPDDLGPLRERMTLFLASWLGGPNVYVERYGHPRLRTQHLPFAIGEAERDQWLLCMNRALDDCAVQPELRRTLSQAFSRMADHLQNQFLSDSLGRLAEEPEAVESERPSR